jgi:hypothetical protein
MEVGDRVDGDTTILKERGKEVWEEILHNRRSFVQQYMNMSPLRHSLARLYLLWKGIALDHRHLLEMVREDAARQESCHTGTDHHGVLATEAAL